MPERELDPTLTLGAPYDLERHEQILEDFFQVHTSRSSPALGVSCDAVH